jgi:acetyl esterase/lipase
MGYLLVTGGILYGQQLAYDTKKDISYYSEAIIKTDAYLKERCLLDIYYPKNKKNFATVIYFHGGGLKAGDKQIPKALKEKGVAVIAPNYRLYPKVKAPVYIEDAAAAVAWAFNHINSYGGDSSRIFISGHSAGGYLTSMVGLDKKWLAQHNIDANRLAGLIPFSGHAITHFTVREERGIKGTQPIVDNLAPLFHVRADASPYLMITGDRELELLGRYEENAYMMRMMKVTGHRETKIFELDGYCHGMEAPAFALLLNEIHRIISTRNNEHLDH